MSLKSRLPKINTVATASTTRQISSSLLKTKAVKSFHVNSLTDNRPLQVNLTYTKGSQIIQAELFDYKTYDTSHPANDSFTICYQVLGAIKYACERKGKTVSFCDKKWKAEKLLNFGGEIWEVANKDGVKVWAVIRDKPLGRLYWFGFSVEHSSTEKPNQYKFVPGGIPSPNEPRTHDDIERDRLNNLYTHIYG